MRYLAIESAGLFWLFVEILILFVVLAGRRYLSGESTLWSAGLKRRASLTMLGFAFLAAATFGRHLFLVPVHRFLAAHVAAGQVPVVTQVKMVVSHRAHEHLLLWSLFIFGWVLLEVMIVYHGWCSAVMIRSRLRAPHEEADS